MPHSSINSPVFARFIAPLLPFQAQAKHQYTCHQVPDFEWITAGLERTIGNHRSGCAFLQDRALRDDHQLRKSHYFESCKSSRRHAHLASISQQFVRHHARNALKANDLLALISPSINPSRTSTFTLVTGTFTPRVRMMKGITKIAKMPSDIFMRSICAINF